MPNQLLTTYHYTHRSGHLSGLIREAALCTAWRRTQKTASQRAEMRARRIVSPKRDTCIASSPPTPQESLCKGNRRWQLCFLSLKRESWARVRLAWKHSPPPLLEDWRLLSAYAVRPAITKLLTPMDLCVCEPQPDFEERVMIWELEDLTQKPYRSLKRKTTSFKLLPSSPHSLYTVGPIAIV